MNNDSVKVLLVVMDVRFLLLMMVNRYYHEENDDLLLVDLMELLDELVIPDMKNKLIYLFSYLEIIYRFLTNTTSSTAFVLITGIMQHNL
jgi:hypothetical protein